MDIITTMTTSTSLRAARAACGTGFTFDLSGYPSALGHAGAEHTGAVLAAAQKPSIPSAGARGFGKRRPHLSRFSPYPLGGLV